MNPKEQDHSSATNIPLLASNDDVEKGNRVLKTDGASFFETTFNGLNSLSGVGILSIPYALSNGGWLSLILLFMVASATFYTGLLIKRCMDFDLNIRTYPDVGDKAFGTRGRMVVSIFMHIELYLVATGFLIILVDNLHDLLARLELDFYGINIGGRQSLVIIVALILMPTVWINNMRALSYVSATGVLACVVTIGSVLWVGTSDDIGFHKKGTLINWTGIPTAFSLYMFSYGAHPVFPTLHNSMRNRRQFFWVLLVCFLFCSVTSACMAISGYLMFGSEVKSQITLNLPTNNISSKVAIYTALVTPLAKYALMLRPIVEGFEDLIQSHRGKKSYGFFVRTILVISSAIVASTVPFFGYLMALVGAFLNVTASILLPCFCYLKISGAYRKLGVEVAIIGFIVLMGLVILVTGTYTSLKKIIQNL
ncbi:amino acid transporter AVT1I-like [Primulina eburnea]|uniref:amino acid transporter AVT1I-like n=1 Tax=Primulina eburnea TaxID=1245227 RepID=UPI003C6C3644